MNWTVNVSYLSTFPPVYLLLIRITIESLQELYLINRTASGPFETALIFTIPHSGHDGNRFARLSVVEDTLIDNTRVFETIDWTSELPETISSSADWGQSDATWAEPDHNEVQSPFPPLGSSTRGGSTLGTRGTRGGVVGRGAIAGTRGGMRGGGRGVAGGRGGAITGTRGGASVGVRGRGAVATRGARGSAPPSRGALTTRGRGTIPSARGGITRGKTDISKKSTSKSSKPAPVEQDYVSLTEPAETCRHIIILDLSRIEGLPSAVDATQKAEPYTPLSYLASQLLYGDRIGDQSYLFAVRGSQLRPLA